MTPALVLTGALAAMLYIVGLALALPDPRLAVKALPVLCLAAWAWPSGDRRIAWGLLAGAAGDLLLALPGAFIAGMAAFAIGHALYVAAFWHRQRAAAPLLALPVLAYLAVPLTLMWPGLGELALPVTAYMLVIGAMIWRAAACAALPAPCNPAARWPPLAGALLFGFSDTLIGIDRFVTPLPAAPYAIITLYWAGQWLIAATARTPSPEA